MVKKTQETFGSELMVSTTRLLERAYDFASINRYYVASAACSLAAAGLFMVYADHHNSYMGAKHAALTIDNLMHGDFYPQDFGYHALVPTNVDLTPDQMHAGLAYAQTELQHSAANGYSGLEPVMRAVEITQSMDKTQAMKDVLAGPGSELAKRTTEDSFYEMKVVAGTGISAVAGAGSFVWGHYETPQERDIRRATYDGKAIA